MIEQTLIRMPKELKDIIRELARKQGLTVNAVILQQLWKLKEKKEEV